MCLFHKWSKWKEYTVYLPERRLVCDFYLRGATEYRQKRVCEKCGKVADKLIRHVIHP